jgi:adenylate cyclase
MKPVYKGVGAGLLCAAVVALAAWLDPTFFGLEPLLDDRVARGLAAGIRPDPRIVIVAINDKSVMTLEAALGARPQDFSRGLYAMVIDEARRGGAKVVVFDKIFSGENPADPEGDRRFAEALASMPTVMAAQTTAVSSTQLYPPEYESKLWNVAGSERLPPLQLIAPHVMFHTASAIGTFRLAATTANEGRVSSVARRYPVLDRVGSARFVPSLGVATLALTNHLPPAVRFDGGSKRISISSLNIPVDNNGTFLLRWSGSTAQANPLIYDVVDFDRVIAAASARESEGGTISVADLERFERERFHDRIVLVGDTAAGLFDLRSTPLGVKPGVVIHANAIDNLINGHFNRAANLALILPLMLLVTTLASALLYTARTQWLATLLLALFLGAWLAIVYFSASSGWIVQGAPPLAATVLVFIITTILKFVAEQDKTRELRRTFGRYVSPQILEHILAHPEKVDLGGDRVDLTVLFSDIRGFTSISEAAEPEQVVEMLNEYLTRMVEILLRHGGTLDKFIGDAVMGFWNAPTADRQHALHAVQCAIEMIDETARLRGEWEKVGKASIRIGVGINTGEAVVGNIGSKQVLSYTVIGDAVNLASRLEGKNKDYGTEIIISEFTRERIGDAVPSFYLDDVKVKGKEKAVKIYQVKGQLEE